LPPPAPLVVSPPPNFPPSYQFHHYAIAYWPPPLPHFRFFQRIIYAFFVYGAASLRFSPPPSRRSTPIRHQSPLPAHRVFTRFRFDAAATLPPMRHGAATLFLRYRRHTLHFSSPVHAFVSLSAAAPAAAMPPFAPSRVCRRTPRFSEFPLSAYAWRLSLCPGSSPPPPRRDYPPASLVTVAAAAPRAPNGADYAISAGGSTAYCPAIAATPSFATPPAPQAASAAFATRCAERR